MVANQVNGSGECEGCKTNVNEADVLICSDCKTVFHAICGEETPFGSKTWISNFKKVKVCNFLFACDICVTKREQNEASSMKQQMAALTSSVATLVKEFELLKEENAKQKERKEGKEVEKNVWSNTEKIQNMKSSLHIKSKGKEVNLVKIQEIAVKNGIQVSKTVVKENGDVYVDLPNAKNREKFTPLLNDEEFAEHEIISLKSKLPTISILDVKEYTTKEDFIERVKKQNEGIRTLIEGGSEFSIVYSKGPENTQREQKHHLVVARVSEEIRKVIKSNRDKIFAELSTYRVIDRFYIKRCNKCQKFGHYEKDCQNEARCGYCCGSHLSTTCTENAEKIKDLFKCVNCKDNGKNPEKHSAFWHKCPTHIEMQKKMKKTIPFYQKN